MSKSESDKIICLECGKYFDFLAPHVNKAHQMTLIQYRERWKIPKQKPLASIKHRQRCRDVTNERIARERASETAYNTRSGKNHR